MYRDLDSPSKSRRMLLRGALALPAVVLSKSAQADVPTDEILEDEKTRHLRLANRHTGERLDVTYWRDGSYISDHIGQLNYFMRDHRENKSALMDTDLYDYLYKLSAALKTEEPIQVLSGYRTPSTNEMLRKASAKVAKFSLHTHGRAVDFYIPGIPNTTILFEARRLELGGVGYYLKSGFIHVDTGRPRHWVTV